MAGAQSQRLLQARRDAAAEAWLAYFDLAAAIQEQRISERFETISQQVKDAAKATASNGLLPPVDADLAETSWSQARQAALASRAATTQARLRLTALLGGLPGMDTPSIASDLEPIHDVEAFAKRSLSSQANDLPEMRALSLEQQALRHHATLLRRSRVPNLTLAAFLERDTFEGRLVGGALSIPIPLPEPLGRTASGEIAESEALASRADSELRRLKRASRLRIAQGLAELDAKRQELAALDDAQVARALRTLDALAAEVRAGRMGVRDALLSQERLIAFLRARAEAEHVLANASVMLAQASGFPLERSGS